MVGRLGRTFGQTTKRHERLVIEFVRSFGPSPALTGHSSLRLTRHHSHHFSGLPLRSVPVPPLARKTESNVCPHHSSVGRGSYGTVQSRRFALPRGRVTWDGTWDGIGRPFGARASFRIELAHERDDAFRPTRRETTVKRSRRCLPPPRLDKRPRRNKEKRVCLRESTLVNPTARDLNKSAGLSRALSPTLHRLSHPTHPLSIFLYPPTSHLLPAYIAPLSGFVKSPSTTDDASCRLFPRFSSALENFVTAT